MITVPCDTIARLSHVLPKPGADVEPVFFTMRLDNGRAIVSNRKFGAVEQLAPFTGVCHLPMTDALVQACRDEAVLSHSLTVMPDARMAYTNGGYMTTDVLPHSESVFDLWYDRLVVPCLTPATSPNGAMVVDAVALADLASSSPSGTVVFETLIDSKRTTILRDANDHRWAGFFMPRLADGMFYPPADVPSWLRNGQ